MAARADHAAHQSSQRETDAVTSWKSASGTPCATKRGAQWEIAASTRGSISVLVWMTADMFSGSPLKRIPPRRFAPPLLKRGGENHPGASRHPSSREEGKTTPALRATPPQERRGKPPRRFAPPPLIRGGEIRTGLSIPNSCRAQYPFPYSGGL